MSEVPLYKAAVLVRIKVSRAQGHVLDLSALEQTRHTRQSRLISRLGFQIKVSQAFRVVLSSLGSAVLPPPT